MDFLTVDMSMNVLYPATLTTELKAPARKKGKRDDCRLIVMLIVMVGFGVSCLAYWGTKHFVETEQENWLQSEAIRHAHLIRNTVDRHFELIQSIGGLYGASDTVTRDEFEKFTTPSLKRHSSLLALAWVPSVPSVARKAYEDEARRSGLVDYQFVEKSSSGGLKPAMDRAVHFPVYYAVTSSDKLVALGYDLASDPVRRKALIEAVERKTITASAKVNLLSGNGAGVLVFLPIYQNQAEPSERSAQTTPLQGLAVGAINLNKLLRSVLSITSEQIDIYLFDRGSQDDPLLVRAPMSDTAHDDGVKNVDDFCVKACIIKEIEVAGRRWAAAFRSANSNSGVIPFDLAILLFSLSLTAMAARYVYHTHQYAHHMESLVQQKTDELNVANNDVDPQSFPHREKVMAKD